MAKGQQFTSEEFEAFADELSEVIAAGNEAGREMGGLKQMRTALRRVGRQMEEAEQRGYARAQAEVQTRGVLLSKGVPETAASFFSETDLTDAAAVDAKIAELKGQGITFAAPAPAATEGAPPAAAGTPPLQTAVIPGPPTTPPTINWEQVAKGLQNVPLQPGMTPEALIAAAVGQQQAAQAGGSPPGSSGDIVADIQAAAKDPGRLTEDGALALAERFNRELDALSGSKQGYAVQG